MATDAAHGTFRSDITTRKRQVTDPGFIKPRIPVAVWIGGGAIAALAVGIAAAFVGAVTKEGDTVQNLPTAPEPRRPAVATTPPPHGDPPPARVEPTKAGTVEPLRTGAATTTTPESEPEPERGDPSRSNDPDLTEDDSEEGEDEGERGRRGSVHIQIQPHGHVIIDGHNHGPAPQTVRLRAGTHRIWSTNSGVRPTTIEVEAGESQRVLLR